MSEQPPLYNSVAPLANVARLTTLVKRLETREHGLRGMGCIYGHAGLGKTTAAIYATNSLDACNVEALPIGGVKALLAMISTELGLKPQRTTDVLFIQVAQQLARSQRTPNHQRHASADWCSRTGAHRADAWHPQRDNICKHPVRSKPSGWFWGASSASTRASSSTSSTSQPKPEFGENANGSYSRLANGAMTCTRSVTTSASGAVTALYAVPFAVSPAVAPGVLVAAARGPTLGARGATSVDVSAFDNANARQSNVVDLTITGRWF